jgi:uncharacterized metal-binding protein YceD (DUF177 family)
MPDILSRSPGNPDFARVVEVSRLRGRAAFDFDLAPDPHEAAALARLMGAEAVRKLRFRGRLVAAPDGAWRLDAELGATVVQTCVVSLEPVTTRVDAPVRRLFSPDVAEPEAEVVVSDLEDDETEPLGAAIDLGLVAIEALALALPAYPRRSGARLAVAASAPPGAAPLVDSEVKPFAALASLRAKMGEGQ